MKERIKKAFPFLATARWYLRRRLEGLTGFSRAFGAAVLPCKPSYAQHQEDLLVSQTITDDDIRNGVYVDVGANHPTVLSNTFLFYRKGGSGIVIEPNRAFKRLYSWFRPRDVFLGIGCAERASLMTFHHHPQSTVFSGFSPGPGAVSHRTECLPLLPLDSVMPLVGSRPIYLLSVDAEGLDIDVLKGGSRTLERTQRVIVEFGDHQNDIARMLTERGFSITHTTTHNMILERNPAAVGVRGHGKDSRLP